MRPQRQSRFDAFNSTVEVARVYATQASVAYGVGTHICPAVSGPPAALGELRRLMHRFTVFLQRWEGKSSGGLMLMGGRIHIPCSRRATEHRNASDARREARTVLRRARVVACLAVSGAALALFPSAVHAADCLEADPPPITSPAKSLRFGITPQVAGHTGATQGDAAPEDPVKTVSALHALEPDNRQLVLRLNRLFWSDGQKGINRFAEKVDAYAAEGFKSEVQVRYHPPDGQEGDIAAWEEFVRAAVRKLAKRRSVVAMSITNEANFPLSPNTSDGAYEGVMEALVRGTAVARTEADRLGRSDLELGFTVMWRWEPESDERFWAELGERATPEFRAALDYVGVQAYPGLVWPPAPLPGRTAGREVVEALTLVRGCHMPKARLGREVDLWVSENGYATNLGRSEQQQREDLTSTVKDVHSWSGTLGVTDYRYFNLRDNRSNGSDLFDAVGLMEDDYIEKLAFPKYGSLVKQHGEDAP